MEVRLTLYPPHLTWKYTIGRNTFSVVFYLPRQLSNSPAFPAGWPPQIKSDRGNMMLQPGQYSHPVRWHTSRLQASTASYVVSLGRNTNIKQRTLLPINCRQHSADNEEISGSRFVMYNAVNFCIQKAKNCG